jgi:hypothetical protein
MTLFQDNIGRDRIEYIYLVFALFIVIISYHPTGWALMVGIEEFLDIFYEDSPASCIDILRGYMTSCALSINCAVKSTKNTSKEGIKQAWMHAILDTKPVVAE